MSQREARIFRHRLLEKGAPLLDRIGRALVQQIASAQIQIICLRILGERLGQLRRLGQMQLDPQRACHFFRHVALQGKKILLGRIIRFRPKMESVATSMSCADNAHLARSVADASFQHVANAELPANLANVQVLILEREGSGSGDDEKPVHVRERVDDLFGDAVAEILLVLCWLRSRNGRMAMLFP